MVQIIFTFEKDQDKKKYKLDANTLEELEQQRKEFLRKNVRSLKFLDKEEEKDIENKFALFDATKNEFIDKSLSSNQELIMKSCYTLSKYIIDEIKRASQDTDQKKMAKISFDLKKYSSNALFVEEFIYRCGLEELINFIEKSSGNVKNYAIESLTNIMKYKNAIQYFVDEFEIFKQFYNNLYTDETNIKIKENILSAFTSIFRSGEREQKIKMSEHMLRAEAEYSSLNEKQKFSDLIGLMDRQMYCPYILTMINNLLDNIEEKIKIKQTLNDLHAVGLYEKLTAVNSSDANKKTELKNLLNEFQRISGEIITGSVYQCKILENKLGKKDLDLQRIKKENEMLYNEEDKGSQGK